MQRQHVGLIVFFCSILGGCVPAPDAIQTGQDKSADVGEVKATGSESDSPNRVYGKLTVLGSHGTPGSGSTVLLGGVKRAELGGATPSRAVWRFHGLEIDDAPRGLSLAFDTRVYRDAYRPQPCHARVALSLKNPKSGLESERFVADLVDGGRVQPCYVAIPSTMRAADSVADRDELALGADLVSDGELDVVVSCLDAEVYLGLREHDLYIALEEAKPAESHDMAKNASFDVGVALEPYARAMAACQNAWKQYEAAAFERNNAEGKRRCILVNDEVGIVEQLESILLQCLKELESAKNAQEDARTCLHIAILWSLLGDDGSSLTWIRKASSIDGRYKSFDHLLTGQRFLANADIDNAWRCLTEAVRSDPRNGDAYALLQQVSDMMGEPIPEEMLQVSPPEPYILPNLRTLPWKTALPFDESVRALGRTVRLRSDLVGCG